MTEWFCVFGRQSSATPTQSTARTRMRTTASCTSSILRTTMATLSCPWWKSQVVGTTLSGEGRHSRTSADIHHNKYLYMHINRIFFFLLRVSWRSWHPGGAPGGGRCHPASGPGGAAHLEAAHHHPRPAGVCQVRGGAGQSQVGHGEDGVPFCYLARIHKNHTFFFFLFFAASQGNNPLYKGATSTFTNVAYRGN